VGSEDGELLQLKMLLMDERRDEDLEASLSKEKAN